MSTTPVVPSTPTTTSTGLPSGQSLNNMFLQLLVAQLQNQDPTSPVDPSQFVGQLAQFSELSEVTSIYTLLQQYAPTTSTGTGSSGGTSTGGGSGSGSALPPVVSAPALAAASAALPGGASNLTSLPNFASPSVAALTSKIQGAF